MFARTKHASEVSTLAMKSRTDVTRGPKQVYQWSARQITYESLFHLCSEMNPWAKNIEQCPHATVQNWWATILSYSADKDNPKALTIQVYCWFLLSIFEDSNP